ncbi:MAG TPA: ABC transporter transmembrane domain-containing protein [Humisphaera sp.]|jgi:ABC-type multidrug transport system fused ATPase/permease subunit|nr:ABC transporter transmembrane domain-containing protein [Humisphaera sp.]
MSSVNRSGEPQIEPKRKKEKGTAHFWRACRFLYPYRWLVIISILCAVFVSSAATVGLTTILPVMRVMVRGDTIATWANRTIAQNRLGFTLADEGSGLIVLKVEPKGAAAQAGLKSQDVLFPTAQTDQEKAASAQLFGELADPDAASATLPVKDRGNLTVAQMPLIPYYQRVGRQLTGRLPSNPVKAIAVILAFLVGLAIVANVVKFFQEYLSDKSAVLAVNDIRRRLYDRVLHIPLSHFNVRGTSDVTSRLTQDAQGLAEGFKTILGQSIQEPIKAAMAFSLALILNFWLTMFIVAFTPLMFLAIKKFGKKMRRASKKALVSSATMLGQVEGSLTGIRVVKSANAERFERRRYTRIMDKLVAEQLRMSRIDSFSEPTMETLTLLVVTCVVLYASYLMMVKQTLTLPMFVAVMACLASIGDSLRRVSKVNIVLQKANAAAARIFEIMDLPIEKKEMEGRSQERGARSQNGKMHHASRNGHRVRLAPIQREVRFENITFSYPGSQIPVLIDVDLTVPKGRCVAVVGRNGSGKTTLLALLPRFYDPQKGRVLIDGVDLRDITLKSLREQISIVTQDSVIFPGTIAENIAYGHPMVAAAITSPAGKELRAKVEEAAHRAFAHDFILAKPQGYDTLLGGLGAQLSGGQKQRLCIARAILRASPILILDEATSQVDAESEALIQRAIEQIMHERTTFVIAHRFSTIKSADEIIVMDKGQIVGRGGHDELLRTCETYQQLYEHQVFGMGAGEVAAR